MEIITRSGVECTSHGSHGCIVVTKGDDLDKEGLIILAQARDAVCIPESPESGEVCYVVSHFI